MSRTIDEKIVEMRFDNKDFERNVSESMSTLDKLKSALNFSGAEKAFDGISSAANKLNFNGVTGAIEEVGHKFSALETMAVGALMNIGATIESKLVNTIKSVSVDQIMAGFGKYGEKTTAVQTIMNATGKEIDEVSDKLQTLNWFTDETSYNFTDMVNNIGKFTSQGVDLDRAVVAMEGISTAAALAGQNAGAASRVMYNFSQALGMGSVKVQDWMSVENANMATQEFKQTIIDTAIELGRLDIYGNIRQTKYALDELGNIQYDELGNIIEEAQNISSAFNGPMFVNSKNMRSTLAAGWFDDKVLIAAMNKFGGFSKRLNEVYDLFNENVDITTSEILTLINGYIDKTLDLDEAVAQTGISAEELLPILEELAGEEYELGRRAFAAAQEAKTFEDAINATKDAVSTAWMNTFEILFGNYEVAKVMWTDLANELWDIFAGPVNDMNEMLEIWADPEGLNGRELFIDSIKNLYGALRSLTDPIAEAWEKIFPSIDAEGLLAITDKFHKFTESLILGEDEMRDIRVLFEGIFGVIKLVTNGIGDLLKAFSGGMSRGKKGFFDGISDSIQVAGAKLGYFIDSIQKVKDRIAGFKAGLISEEDINRLKESQPFFYNLVDTFDKLKTTATLLGVQIGKLFNLKDIIEKFKNAGGGVAGVTEIIFSNWKSLLKTVQKVIEIWTGFNIGPYIQPFIKIIDFVQDKIKEIQESGVLGEIKDKILDVINTFENRFGSVFSWFLPLLDAGRSIINDFIDGIKMLSGSDGEETKSIFDIIKDGLDSIKEFIDTSPELGFLIGVFKDGIAILSAFLSNFLSLRSAVEAFKESGGGVGGFLSIVNDRLDLILGLISDIIRRITGLDISGIGQGISLVIRAIEEGLAHIANFILKLFGWTNNPFAEFLGTGAGALDLIYDKINSFGKDGEKLPITGIFESIGTAFSNLWNTLQKFSPGIKVAVDFVLDVIRNVYNVLKDISFEDALEVAKIFTFLYVGIRVANMFRDIGDAFWEFQKSLKAEAIKDIAIAVAALSGSIYLMSLIDKDKITSISIALGVSLAGLIGLMAFSRKANFKSLASIPGILISMSVAMFAFSRALDPMISGLERLAKLDVDEMTQAVRGFGAISIVFLGFIALAGESTESAKKFLYAFSSISAAILSLFFTVQLFRLVDMEDILESLRKIITVIGSLGIVLAVFSAIEAIISNMTKRRGISALTKSIKEVAKAMLILVATIAIINLMSMEDYAEGILKIVAAIATIGTVIVPLSLFYKPLSNFADVLMKFGKALLFISGVIAIFGLISTLFGDFADTIVQNGVELIANILSTLADKTPGIADSILRIVIGILDAVEEHAPEITSAVMSIVVSILTEIGAALQELDPEPFLKGTAFLAGIIAAMLGIKKLGGVSIKDFIKTSGVILEAALVMIEIIGVLAGIGYLMQTARNTLKIDIVRSIIYVGNVLNEISKILFSKMGLVIASVTALMVLINNVDANFDPSADAGDHEKHKKKNGLLAISKVILEVGAVIGEIVLIFSVLAETVAAMNKGLSSLNGLGNGSGWLGDSKTGEGLGLVEIITYLGNVLNAIANVFFSEGGIIIAAITGIVVVGEMINDKLNDSKLAGSDKQGGKGGKGIFGSVAVTILEIAGVIAVVIAAFGILGEAVAGLDQLFTWFNGLEFMGQSFKNESGSGMGLIDLIKYLGEVLNAIADVFGGVIGHFVGAVIGSAVGEGFAESAKGYAEGLKTVCETMSAVPDDVVTKASLAADMFSTLMMAVPNDGGLLGFLFGSKDKGMESVAESLPSLATALTGFSNNLDGFKPDVVESSKAGIDIILEIAKATPKEGGLWQYIVGSTSKGMEGMAANLASFATALVDYSWNLTHGADGKTFDSEAVSSTKDGIDIILKIAKAVPKDGGMWQWLIGSTITGMEGMAANLKAFAIALVDYSNEINDFKPENVETSNTAVGMILDIAKSIPQTGGLWDDIVGSEATGMDNLTSNLPAFGEALKLYSWQMKYFDTAAVASSSLAIGMIIAISKAIPESKDFWDKFWGKKDNYDDMDAMAKSLPAFGTALSNYSNNIASVSEGTATRTAFALAAIASASMISGYSSTIKDLGSSLKNYYENIKKIDTAKVESVADAFGEMWDVIANMINKTTGRTYVQEFYSIGAGGVAKGFASGIKSGTPEVVDAVQYVGDKSKSAMQTTLESHSPSRVFMKFGSYISEGLALGIAGGVSDVVDSATVMSNALINETKDSLEIHSPSELYLLFGKLCTQGFAEGIYDGIPNIEDALSYIGRSILNGSSLSDIVNNVKNKFGLSMSDILPAKSFLNLSDAFDLETLTGGNFDLDKYLSGELKLEDFTDKLGNKLSSAGADTIRDKLKESTAGAFEVFNESATEADQDEWVKNMMSGAEALGNESGATRAEADIDGYTEVMEAEADRAAEAREAVQDATIDDSAQGALETASDQLENTEVTGPTIVPVIDMDKVDAKLAEYSDDMFTVYGDGVISINGKKPIKSFSSWKSRRDYEAEVMAEAEKEALEKIKPVKDAYEEYKKADLAAKKAYDEFKEADNNSHYSEDEKKAAYRVYLNAKQNADDAYDAYVKAQEAAKNAEESATEAQEAAEEVKQETTNLEDAKASEASEEITVEEPEQVGEIGMTPESAEAIGEVVQNENLNQSNQLVDIMQMLDYNNKVNDELSKYMANIGERVTSIEEKISTTEVYLDGKALVGAMINDIDKELGNRSTLAGRRV